MNEPLACRFIYSQVVIEGVAGVTSASSIAVDELHFSENLTCVSDGNTTPFELFKGNAALVLLNKKQFGLNRVFKSSFNSREYLWPF